MWRIPVKISFSKIRLSIRNESFCLFLKCIFKSKNSICKHTLIIYNHVDCNILFYNIFNLSTTYYPLFNVPWFVMAFLISFLLNALGKPHRFHIFNEKYLPISNVSIPSSGVVLSTGRETVN